MVTEKQPSLEYIAGFFDGEGSVRAQPRLRKTGIGLLKSFEWHLIITNTHKKTLQEIKSVIGGLIRKKSIKPKHGKKRWKNMLGKKKCWKLQICGRLRVRKTLTLLHPYLITKKYLATRLLVLAKDKPPKPRKIIFCSKCDRPQLARRLCGMHYQRWRIKNVRSRS